MTTTYFNTAAGDCSRQCGKNRAPMNRSTFSFRDTVPGRVIAATSPGAVERIAAAVSIAFFMPLPGALLLYMNNRGDRPGALDNGLLTNLVLQFWYWNLECCCSRKLVTTSTDIRDCRPQAIEVTAPRSRYR